ncbi:MAG: hypothetical protein JW936_09550 [Sedimentisphaerales bacterium]|nr:hypothetical protein [Sedimentisphaerales bacterium]
MQRYDRVVKLLKAGEYHKGQVMNAEVEIMDASAVWERGLSALKRNAFALVDPVR